MSLKEAFILREKRMMHWNEQGGLGGGKGTKQIAKNLDCNSSPTCVEEIYFLS
jgi:hypothetical protein